MAKLGSYYGLCPLIDQRSLLGIVADVLPGHVIVTLGKNIAIKYKLSDQKQIHSWRTKDKFTSAVVYEPEEKKYTAVFNQSYIRLWDEDEESIDKQKKYKLGKPIHSILSCGSSLFVVFNGGSIIPLNYVIKNRKNLEIEDLIDSDTEYIGDLFYTVVENETYIGQLIINKDTDEKYFIWSIYGAEKKQEIHKIAMARKDASIVGYCFEKTNDKFNLDLLTLWSDSKLFAYPIYDDVQVNLNQEKPIQPPGNLTAVIESISCSHYVTMATLNEDYLAMYGADKSEEGASLNIYNLQFKVTQTRQPFKMFTNGARLWQIENNLFLGVGQNLAVIPFCLETEQLAALIGSHKQARSEQDPDVTIVQTMQTTIWDEEIQEIETEIAPSIKKEIAEFLEQGWSLNAICEDLLVQVFEKKDLQMLTDVITYFPKMSEGCMAKIIKFLLSLGEDKFRADQDSQVLPEKMRPFQRCRFIDSILALPFTDTFLTSQIRKQLDVSESLALLSYVNYLLQEDSHSLPIEDEISAEKVLIDWGNVILDANYVKILLVKEESIVSILNDFNALVKEHLIVLEDVREAIPVVSAVKDGKYNKLQNVRLPYSIETIKWG